MQHTTSRTRRTIACALAVALASAGLLGCASSQTSDEPDVLSARQINLGIDGGTGTAPYIIAWKKGFFDEEGITVLAGRQFSSGNEALAAELAGEVDLASVTDLPVISARVKAEEQGLGVVELLGAMAVGAKVHALTVNKTIKTAVDLTREGVRVGVTASSGGEYSFHAFLVANDLDPDAITVVNVGTDDMVAAFTRGDIDAYFSWAPITQTGAENVPGARIFAYGDEYGWVSKNYIVASERLSNDTEASASVLRALDHAAIWIEANRDEALVILGETLNVSPETLELPFSLFRYEVSFTKEHGQTLHDVATWAYEAGKVSAVPTWSEFIDLAPMEEAFPGRVTIDLGGLG